MAKGKAPTFAEYVVKKQTAVAAIIMSPKASLIRALLGKAFW